MFKFELQNKYSFISFFCIIYCNLSVNFIVYKINFSHFSFSCFLSQFSTFLSPMDGWVFYKFSTSFLHVFHRILPKESVRKMIFSQHLAAKTLRHVWNFESFGSRLNLVVKIISTLLKKMGLEGNQLDNSCGLIRWSVAQLD